MFHITTLIVSISFDFQRNVEIAKRGNKVEHLCAVVVYILKVRVLFNFLRFENIFV